jgi:hypothetical protein
MDITLVVVRPFGTHVAGDRIAAAPDIAAALASEHAHCVVAIHPVPTPAPTSTGN